MEKVSFLVMEEVEKLGMEIDIRFPVIRNEKFL